MCFCIDDGDKAFEEERCRRNQDALSTSNGLAVDLRAGTSEFNCKRLGGGGKSFFIEGGAQEEKTHLHPLLISNRKGFLKSLVEIRFSEW